MASSTIAQGQERTFPWRLIFRIVRWGSYASALVVLLLVLRKAPPPMVETNPQAAARVEEKFEQVQHAVSAGQPATVRMDQTELNSYLISHLDIAPNATANAAAASNTPSATSGPATEGGAAALSAPNGTTAEQIEQVKSAVKDVKVELIDDRARAYVVFDFHGKDMTLQLEGKLGADNGYLQFAPVSGQIGMAVSSSWYRPPRRPRGWFLGRGSN